MDIKENGMPLWKAFDQMLRSLHLKGGPKIYFPRAVFVGLKFENQ